MATMTVTDTKTIKRAMRTIGLGDRTDDLLSILDKMELDRRLKISLEQADRGEVTPAEEVEKRIMEKFANGYFSKENARRRVEERMKNGR
jgi:hypothetical protein